VDEVIRSQVFTDRLGRKWVRLIPEWKSGYRIATIIPYEK
jgi:hypothetical protein